MSGSRRLVAFAAGCLAMALRAGAAAGCGPDALCEPGTGPCVIATPCTVDAGSTFDLGSRALVLRRDQQLTVSEGFNAVTIRAGSVLLEPGARIVLRGMPQFEVGGTLAVDAAGTITLQSEGAKRASIVAQGVNGGGIVLRAGGDVVLDGLLDASAKQAFGAGGTVSVASGGAVTVAGAGIRVPGGNDGLEGGGGGLVGIDAAGPVTIDAVVDASHGDCGSAEITILSAEGDVAVGPTAVLDVGATGAFGDGGQVAIAAIDVEMAGAVAAASAGSGAEGAGEGGLLQITATGDLDLSGSVDLGGVRPDGDAGSVALELEGRLVLASAASVLLRAEGEGSGGQLLVRASQASLAGLVDVSGDAFGGDVDVRVTEALTLTGTLRADARDPDLAGTGGSVTLDACSIDASSPMAKISSVGPGLAPSASNVLRASVGMTVGGVVHAGTDGEAQGAHNRFQVLPTATVVLASTSDVVPPADTTADPSLRCCGSCVPPTTTTTTTTSTTAPPTTVTSTTAPTTPESTTTSVSLPTTTLPPDPGTTSTTTVPAAETTTTSAPAVTTTSTTLDDACPGLPALDSGACRVARLDHELDAAPRETLGGKRLARRLAAALDRATRAIAAAQEGVSPPASLRRAGRHLRALQRLLPRARRRGMPPDLADRLAQLAGQAAADVELARLRR